MADDQDQGYVPLYQPGAQKPAPAAAAPPQQAPAPVRDPNDQGYVPLVSKPAQTQQTGGASQPSGWGVNWRTGDVTMPQSVQDWGTLAAQNTLMGLYPGLTAQADAARKRLDPLTAGSADVAGSIASPTTLLNAVPVVGPELAGGVHEGTKSAVTNWKPDESWPTYLKNVGEDTAGGVAAGFGGQMAGLAAAKALPELIKGGVMTGSGWVGHKLLGGAAVPDFAKELPGLMGIYKVMDKTADWAGEQGKNLVSSPAAQQAIKSLILGGGSAARNYAGPYDQWLPGQ